MAKVALITGAGRGIGSATAVLAAKHGYDVCINYAADAGRAEETAEACRHNGVLAIVEKADVASSRQVETMFSRCEESLGTPSLLVNNAGIVGKASTVEQLEDEVLHRTYEVNVYGTFYCARAAIRRMSRKNGGEGGVIINISSMAATLGSPGEYVHYAASKAAIDTMTVGLSKEVGPLGIRVNAIQAGTVDTEIHRRHGNPERPAKVAQAAPLGRVATPQDIAEAVLWLASGKATYATGTVLRVAGGL